MPTVENFLSDLPEDKEALKAILRSLVQQRDQQQQRADDLYLENLQLQKELLRYKKATYGPRADRLSENELAQVLLEFAVLQSLLRSLGQPQGLLCSEILLSEDWFRIRELCQAQNLVRVVVDLLIGGVLFLSLGGLHILLPLAALRAIASLGTLGEKVLLAVRHSATSEISESVMSGEKAKLPQRVASVGSTLPLCPVSVKAARSDGTLQSARRKRGHNKQRLTISTWKITKLQPNRMPLLYLQHNRIDLFSVPPNRPELLQWSAVADSLQFHREIHGQDRQPPERRRQRTVGDLPFAGIDPIRKSFAHLSQISRGRLPKTIHPAFEGCAWRRFSSLMRLRCSHIPQGR